ncbi:MAG: hypothetical protein ACRENL_08660 [Candidatus Dormibacteria bacterium]
MTLRGRLVALAVMVAVLLGVTVTFLLSSRTAGCAVLAPRPSLPPALRALGDFEQSYDPANVAALEDAASRAAAVLHPDLIGATAEVPVPVEAAQAGLPNALVVPLRSHVAAPGGSPPLAGLVTFLQDCQGNAYFATVEDDATTVPPLIHFPPVSREQAMARLGSVGLRLDYLSSPLTPEWVTTASPAQSLAAR